MAKKKLKLNFSLLKKYSYKPKPKSLLHSEQELKKISASESRTEFFHFLNMMGKIAEHYNVRFDLPKDPCPFRDLTISILMDVYEIDSSKSIASLELLKKVAEEYIPASKLKKEYPNTHKTMNAVRLVICIEHFERKLGSINSACEHLIKKYGLPLRTRQNYYDAINNKEYSENIDLFKEIITKANKSIPSSGQQEIIDTFIKELVRKR